MVQIYDLDSDTEGLQLARGLDDDGAVFAASSDATHGIRMTPKIPPSFDGTTSWFEYEDLIDDWLGITTLTPRKHGPSLKNSLVGSAAFYKNMFDNTLLRDADQGLNHFKTVLRPYFVKGVQHVFLWRFLQLFRTYRGNSEFVHWIGKFEIAVKRLTNAWMDLLEPTDFPEPNTVAFLQLLTPALQTEIQNIAAIADRVARATVIRDQLIEEEKVRHRNAFPLNDNLMSLIFLVQADLNEQQRERFVSSMSLRQVNMTQYTYQGVRELFMELFCITRTGISDPMIQHRRRTNFFVVEEGEMENEDGFWVIDEDTHEEGFVSLYTEDDFWVLGAKGYSRRRITGRRFKKGRPKGFKGKGKGKRPGFRTRSKGKGYAHYDEYQQQQTDPVFYGKFGKGKGKKGKFKGKKGFGGKDKGKDGKDSFKAKGKGQPSQANVASNQQPSGQEEPNTAHQTPYQEEGWGYQSEWTDWSAADTWYDESYYGQYDDSYDWQGSWSYFAEKVEDGQPDHRTTNEKKSYCSLMSTKDQFRVFGQLCTNAFVAFFVCIAFAVRILHSVMFPEDHDDCPASVGLSNSEPSDHAYLNVHHDINLTLLTEYIDLKTHPTYVILDSGCTKAMGSRYATDRLVHACKQHKDSHNIWFSTESCFSRFAFANGEQSTVRERLIIHLRNRTSTTGWITTSVDILDKGRVPILFSVEQMRNLRMNIEHTPVGEFLTCPMFGMKKTPLAVSTSSHPILDIMSLATAKEKPQHSFLSHALTCPACAGKHRPHTYKDDCKKAKTESTPTKSKKKSEPKESPKTTVKIEPKGKKATKADESIGIFEKAKEPVPGLRPLGEVPPVRSGPASGSREPAPPDGEEERPEPQDVEPKLEVKEEEKVPEKKEPSPSANLPLALRRIHEKLESPTELLKLHLKHYHMSTDQFKRRTSALKLPKEIYERYDLITKQCETCQKAKIAPSRAKVSGIRSEVFGELTFIDHGEVPLSANRKLQFLLIFDGATSLTTSYVVQSTSDAETIKFLVEYFETYQLNPKYIVADQAFMREELESYYNRQGIRPIALGPGTPWPNRAEAAIRMFKKQVNLMIQALRDDPILSDITYQQLLRQASLARNSMVTFGGVTPMEMAFGRRPSDLMTPENMNPAQISAEVPTPEKRIQALRTLAMKKFLEAKQSDDLRKDIASHLSLSDGPFFPGDKIYYWTEDKSKIKSDGSHSGKWIKGKVVSSDGSMVGIDLGTRIVKVNVSKIRKDHNPIEDVDIPLDPAGLMTSTGTVHTVNGDNPSPTAVPKSDRETDPVNALLIKDSDQPDPGGINYGTYHWIPVTKGKIDFLELFAGSARLSHVASMQGMKVGQPIDLRTGFDILTSDGRMRTMKIVEEQKPTWIHMAPLCGPWSQMQNINDQSTVEAKRRKYMPMVEFCVKVAIHQLENRRYFTIENPATSKMWYTKCFERLLKHYMVGYGTLDMCAYGLLDPSGYYYYKPTSLVHNFGEALQPVFKRCSNGLGGEKPYHQRQPIEGNAPGYGSRTNLAQIYPYKFCLTLVKTILPIGNVRCLAPAQSGIVIDLLDNFSVEELTSIEKDVRSVYTDSEHVVYSNVAGKQTNEHLPVNNHDVKRAMNTINSLPNGSHYDPFKLNLHNEIALMRKLYISTMPFENAAIMLGSLQPLRVLYRHTTGVLLLWHKRDNTKLHLVLYPEVDVTNLIESHYSAVFYWNSDNTAPRRLNPEPQQQIQHPPGLDPPDAPMQQPPDDPTDHPDQHMPQQPDPLDPDYGTNGHPPFDDPPQTPPHHPTFDTPLSPEFHSPPPGPDPPDDEMPFHSPQPEPQPQIPTVPIFPGPGPGPGPPPPGGTMIPVSGNDMVQPQTHIPTVIDPPNIPDEQMQHAQKRLPNAPLSWPPASKAKTMPATQMPPRPSIPSNHLGGEVVAKIPSQVASSQPKLPKDEELPNIPDSDDEHDPTAAPSGHQQPLLPYENAESDPLNIPEPQEEQAQESEREDTDETIPYHDDSDDTQDYSDLFVDEANWSYLTQEQKLCCNTASFSVPRYIDGSAVPVGKVQSSSLYGMSYSVISPRKQGARRTNRSDILEQYHGMTEEDKAYLTLYQVSTSSSYLVGKKRKEASQLEKRQLAKQFLEAKQAECKSWIDNEVFDLVDMRKIKVRNYVAGRWVLTTKTDKDGNFLKCKARWVLKGFQDKQKDTQQTDSPAASRAGFRCATQLAANKRWNLFHMDLKTAFLQGEAYDDTRDIICQIPPEYGYPPYMGARLKKPGYGLNDAPRRWWQIIDGALLRYGLIPTRADRCTYILYEDKPKSRIPATAGKSSKTDTTTIEQAIEHLLDPVSQNNAQGRKPHGFICLHVDDLFMGGDKVFEDKILASIRKDFNVGSEDKNDIMFVGQRIKWKTHDKFGPYISADQKLAVDAVEEIKFEKSLKDNIACTPQLHTAYRSVLGQLNWLQSRTQAQLCYKFSRCASAASSPTIGDVREINKVVRTLKNQYVDARFWPLNGTQRILGMPDASYRNNSDKSSQRAHVIFLAEDRKVPSRGQSGQPKTQTATRGSIVDYESHKITTTTQSTTVAELGALMKCFGTCLFVRALWADVSGEILPIHIRTDANNLVTTAQTTHLPEQKETHHLIQMLRHESNSGHLDDLSHIASEYCLADPLTKHSAKPDQLIQSIETGQLEQVDVHPPFRSLLKHKAFLVTWSVDHLSRPAQIHTVFGEDIHDDIYDIYHVMQC